MQSMLLGMSNRKLTVLQSFPVPRPTTNPYLVMLQNCLREEPGVEVLNFTWSNALRANYDVFHVHWPEILVGGRTLLRKSVRQLLTIALLLRLGFKGTPIVRTVHNILPPEGISHTEKILLRIIERRTKFRITLNCQTPVDAAEPYSLIPHGHYRDWFSSYNQEDAVPGSVACVGLIRRYKGVEGLLAAFQGTEQLMAGLSLSVVGNPSTPGLRDSIRRLACLDPRIHLQLEFISDEQIVKVVTSSELIVLPYRFMHNSGAALVALSLGRPVLVPANAVNRALGEEVGQGWVYTFEGDIQPEDIVRTLKAVRARKPTSLPKFRTRNWAEGSAAHVRAYVRALALAPDFQGVTRDE